MIDSIICTDNPNNFYTWQDLWQNNTLYFKHHIRLFEWAKDNTNELKNLKFIILDRFTGNHDAIQTNLAKELRDLGFKGFIILSSYKHDDGEKVSGFDISIGSIPISRNELEEKLCIRKLI